MDSGSSIIGAVIVVICITPFLIMYYKKLIKTKKLLKSLTDIAEKNNFIIDKYEFCGDFIISMDTSKEYVLFYKKNKIHPAHQIANLRDVKNCKVSVKTHSHKNDDGGISIIDSVELWFMPIDKTKEVIRFELYEKETNIQLSGEIQLAEKWENQINKLLKNKS